MYLEEKKKQPKGEKRDRGNRLYNLAAGIPKMKTMWRALRARYKAGKLSKDERIFYDRLLVAFSKLRKNPHDGNLHTHDSASGTKHAYLPNGEKIWQSDIDRVGKYTRRFLWAYGPSDGIITILGLRLVHLKGKQYNKKQKLDKMPEFGKE